MATKFTKGQQVKLNMTVPAGAVEKLRMTEDGVIEYMIIWKDADGVSHERWFEESQLIEG